MLSGRDPSHSNCELMDKIRLDEIMTLCQEIDRLRTALAEARTTHERLREAEYEQQCRAERAEYALAEAQRERDAARMARDHRETEHGAEKERRLAAEADNEELLELLGRYKDLTEALRSRVDYQGPQWWCLSALLDSFDEADTAIREARRGE